MTMQRYLQQRATPVIIGVLTIGLALSLIDGNDQHLPSVTLGSSVLLHIERAAIFLAVIYLIYILIIYTKAGQIPHQLGGIEFQHLQEEEREETATLETTNNKVEILAATLEEQQAITNKLLQLLQPDIDNQQHISTIRNNDE